MEKPGNRIKLLDGFRAIAIMAVLLFHFFSRYAGSPSLYPYNNKYNFFSYGFMGVHFFFLISGFVIFFTLEKTATFPAFWKKRLIRLFPSMAIASVLTFIIFRLFDNQLLFPESHRVANFATGLTFINPALINYMLHPRVGFQYLSGSYWSLWPEIQFYLFASVLFYINKKNFTRNFSLISVFLICVNHLMQNILKNNVLHIHLPQAFLNNYLFFYQLFNLLYFLPFFCAGMLFYLLYKHNNQANLSVKICLGFFLTYIFYTGFGVAEHFIYTFMFALFFCFIYYPKKLAFLNNPLISRIGISSYFLYLIHEHIGVLMINKLGKHFMPAGFVFTILLICCLTFISILYSETIEKRISAFLRGKK
ncbi:acyltransferase family protein [Mucilaginibacter xinganensis]|uniref:Acyltransferase 3 domain-containing protein n=1 Tax=Mucilaginibacter xinganensis TaxID=1234841 RepID=A0A223P408_9SPHI|nr:acyltransferase [Mucilaginibacter xinganensis]ASU36770.1 hypothetical protein MuYL_4887 [Mucilaginibacter xinganensis]